MEEEPEYFLQKTEEKKMATILATVILSNLGFFFALHNCAMKAPAYYDCTFWKYHCYCAKNLNGNAASVIQNLSCGLALVFSVKHVVSDDDD